MLTGASFLYKIEENKVFAARNIWNGYNMYFSSTEEVPIRLLRAVPGTQAGDLRWSLEKDSKHTRPRNRPHPI